MAHMVASPIEKLEPPAKRASEASPTHLSTKPEGQRAVLASLGQAPPSASRKQTSAPPSARARHGFDGLQSSSAMVKTKVTA